ncbi:MAG: sigma-70 family RNA polymerase sigma factor [Gemmataceae bacterium]
MPVRGSVAARPASASEPAAGRADISLRRDRPSRRPSCRTARPPRFTGPSARPSGPAASRRRIATCARFADGDQAAFAALVERHAGLVFGVCRRALPTVQDAEDAAQATFLVLARKAATMRWQTSAASWLYATARRVAQNARRAADRRAKREAKAATPEAVEPADQLSARELFAILDDELGRLAAMYREPLVLCYLQELTRDEAASRLGVPLGTLKTRIDRGRKKLGAALTRRGVVAGIGVLALAATSPAGASPPRLVEAVLAIVGGEVPAAVAALAEGVAVNGLFPKSLWVAALACAATVGIGVGVVRSPAGQPPAKGPAKQDVIAKPQVADGAVYRGRVVGPDGKPVAGAKLYLTPAMGYLKQPYDTPVRTTTDRDGRFEFPAPKAPEFQSGTVAAAAAADFGPGWVQVNQGGKTDDMTLRLVPDDVAITGQVVDLEGRPVAKATLRVLQINAAANEDLGPWLDAAAAKKGHALELEQQHVGRFTIALTPTVTTDTEGRFRLTGIGRNRLVRFQLDGPTVASQHLHVLTRSGKAVEVTYADGDPEYGWPRVVTTYHGADFRFAAGPTKPVVGVVRDKDTKRPLAGVAIYSDKLGGNPLHGVDIVRTVTDAHGRYRLVGLPKGAGSKILVVPPDDQPYVAPRVDVPDSPGLDAVTLDVELKRGVWVEGTVRDKATGKPVRCSLMYLVRNGNPNLRDYPGFYGGLPFVATRDDGTYRIIAVPGPGEVVVFHPPDTDYLLGAERDDADGLHQSFGYMPPGNFAAFARIDPAAGVASVRRDIELVPGRTFAGTVVGPDGKPLVGAQPFGATLAGAAFTVRQFNPHRPRPVFFRHPATGLVGVATPPAEDGGAVTVRMGPGAAATGRLVDADGTPRAGTELRVWYRPKGEPHWDENGFPDAIATGADGRFRITALVPGYDYRLHGDRAAVRFGDGLKSGAVKDLGDVRLKP